MARIVLEGKLLKWGNSYGVRVAKADVERAGLHVGAKVEVQTGEPGKVDLSHIPTFRLGGGLTRQEREEFSYQRGLDKLVRSGSLTKKKADAEIALWRKRQGAEADVGH